MHYGCCADYVRETYQRWFFDELEHGSEPNVSESLMEIGQQPEKVLDLAADEAIAKAYLSQTEKTQSKHIFGSPSFIVDGELFWGDDCLEDAVNWYLI